jgi:hypothetical protein
LKYAKQRGLNNKNIIVFFKGLLSQEFKEKKVTLSQESLDNLTFLYMILAKNLWVFEAEGNFDEEKYEILRYSTLVSLVIVNKNWKLDNHDMSRFRFRAINILMRNAKLKSNDDSTVINKESNSTN